ncbi:lariat debranching enzyme, C-terminal domain-containing protein [Mycena rebaudengoi]|nr:lariat debranching enzyme, C-terminal domain-containing protein [Mycena rebaudengoi]
MKVAVEGCCHGELDAIYAQIEQLEQRNNYKVDVLLICGDFQAIRNHQDLQCMAVPDKYKQLGGLPQTAPVLTIVIGGNHEASNYMWELYYGGWLAPNIYYLGEAGCVRVNGLRIAGASGIYKVTDFNRGHFEKMPYDRTSIRSIYHIREYAVRKLSLISPHLDVFLSHDWPLNITSCGDLGALLSRKSFLRADIIMGRLGSPPLQGLLLKLKPAWWFAAHLHTRFEAVVVHGEPDAVEEPIPDEIVQATRDPNEIVIDDEEDFAAPASASAPAPAPDPVATRAAPLNPDEITLSDLEDEVAAPLQLPPPVAEPRMYYRTKYKLPAPLPGQTATRFLALDKCAPKRQYLEVVDIPVPEAQGADEGKGKGKETAPRLTYDAQWLAITRAFFPFLTLAYGQRNFPTEEEARELISAAREVIAERARARGELDIDDLEVERVQQFVMTAPGPGREDETGGPNAQPPWYTNQQTLQLCDLIGVENRINSPPKNVMPKDEPVPAAAPVPAPGDDAKAA